MRTLIQLRGSCGCGKTTAARSLIKRGNYIIETVEILGKKYPYTVRSDRKVIITGRYDQRECGGCDGIIKNKDLMKEYISALLRLGAEYIIFEAVMYGVTYKFSYELSKVCSAHGYNYKAYVLAPDFGVSLERVYGRNHGKQVNVEKLAEKYDRCVLTSKRLKADGVNVEFVDTSVYKPDEMHKFITKDFDL